MNELKVFENPDFGQVRTIEIDNEPWFVGKDVAVALGYSDTKSAISDHVDAEDKTLIQRGQIATLEIPNRGLTIINESGLYSLILSSKLPTAKDFKRWITKEVIPSIRKTGGYQMPSTPEQRIAAALIDAQRILSEYEEKNQALAMENSALAVDKAIMQPKADYFDELVERNLLTNFRETAKQLGVGQKEFISFLLSHKYLYRDKRGKLLPYAGKNDGLFEVKECINEKTDWPGTQTLITPKGRETFRLLCIPAGGD